MPVSVVVGTQWGDEGKAKIIDLLAESHQVVARFRVGITPDIPLSLALKNMLYNSFQAEFFTHT